MQCDEAKELLSPYLDGELTPEQRMAVDTHLIECSQCADELAGFQAISRLAARLVDPVPPSDLSQQIDQARVVPPHRSGAPPVAVRRSSRKVWRVVVAALLLVGAGLTFGILQWADSAEHTTVSLDAYLTQFAADPHAAQTQLIAKYENRQVDVTEAAEQLRYRPTAAGPLPNGVAVQGIRVFEMPCCRCLQTVCTIDGNHTVVIFEHADEHSFKFGRRPSMTCQCKGHKTRILQFNGQMVASWAKGKRHLTLIGARDLSQVVQFVERLE